MSLEATLDTVVRTQKRWNWRRDLNYFFVALTDIFWLAPFVELVGINTSRKIYPQDLGRIFILVSLNVLVALGIRRFLIFKQKMSNQQLPYFLGGIFISLMLTLVFLPLLTQTGSTLNTDLASEFGLKNTTFPPAVIYFLLVGFLWYRGWQIGKGTLTHIAVSLQMRIGILMFFLICVVGNATIQDDMLTLLPLFFASGLMALALARSATLHIDENERSRFGMSWLGFLMTMVIVIISLAFIAALIMAGIDRNQALEVFKFIGAGFVTLVFLLASPFLWLGNELFNFLLGINDTPTQTTPEEGGKIIPGQAKDVERWDYSDELNTLIDFVTNSALYITIIAMTVVFIGFWISFFMTRENMNFDKEENEDADERELIGGIRKTLGNQLKKLGDMFNMVRQFGFGADLMGVLTIRWAYGRMEREAKKRGFARGKSQTPYEYRRLVGKAFPGGEEQIKLITDAYVAIRYGELPENNDRLDRVRQALDQLMAIEAPPTTG